MIAADSAVGLGSVHFRKLRSSVIPQYRTLLCGRDDLADRQIGSAQAMEQTCGEETCWPYRNGPGTPCERTGPGGCPAMGKFCVSAAIRSESSTE
jgi:hypothetical protein